MINYSLLTVNHSSEPLFESPEVLSTRHDLQVTFHVFTMSTYLEEARPTTESVSKLWQCVCVFLAYNSVQQPISPSCNWMIALPGCGRLKQSGYESRLGQQPL